MRFTNNEAVELGNALLDAVELSTKCKEEVNITSTKSGNLLAIHGDKDCGTRYTVDPPIEMPDTPKLKAVS